jgi:pimeloyl-ACP methyl ester carboxylesterase
VAGSDREIYPGKSHRTGGLAAKGSLPEHRCLVHQIKAPSLLIVGQLDRTALGKNLVPESVALTMGNYPELGRLTAGKIRNCRLIEIQGVGHVPHIEVFDKFIESLLGFL